MWWIKNDVLLSLDFHPKRFFPSKILTRWTPNGHPMMNVMKLMNDYKYESSYH